MRQVNADILVEKAKDEAKSMSEPFKSNFAVLVEWLVEKTSTIEPGPQWIPVSERLPEEGKDVLAAVYFEGVKGFKPCHYVDIASRIDNEWSSDSDEHKIARDKHHIIAWMPLPEPYVEG